jgi:putative ABC transport system substrate-binding protein
MLTWVATALALLLSAAPLAVAQPTGKVFQVGLLLPGNPTGPDPARKAFLNRLAELGWAPGENLVFAPRYAEGQLDRLPQLAAELVQLKVSLIVTAGTHATWAAKRATTTIPIVMFAGDPVGSGIVASLARPSGNITGLTIDAGPELGAKRELLKEVAPKVSRVGILWDPLNPGEEHFAKIAEPLARSLGLTLLPVSVRSPSDFDEAFAQHAVDRGLR